jgi:hypothetical protein
MREDYLRYLDSMGLAGDARLAWGVDALYEYNQIAGWARLTVAGQLPGKYATLKGYYSRRHTKRITRNCRAPFDGSYKFTEFGVRREDSSEEIVDKIRSQVLQLTRRGRSFAGRYVDFEVFDSLAPWINWHALFQLDAEPGRYDLLPLNIVGIEDDLST